MSQRHFSRLFSCVVLASWFMGCAPPGSEPASDSHTNWLRACSSDRDCGALSCICSVCTLSCSSDEACSAAPGSSCLPPTHAGVAAACVGQPRRTAGMCLPTCSADRECADGQACVAGACQPLAAPTAHVTVDTGMQLQRLSGFGATVGYAEDQIAAYPDRSALDVAMFSGLGLDVLRFRNRYGEASEATLKQTADIVASAQQSLGRAPLLLLSSWSPPAALKQNGATFCADPATCTLAKNASGGFDYAGLATHWRNTLVAYARAGFVPDYIGIQNNPDWAPSGGAVLEACKFLPREGSANVFANGMAMPVKYPGYDLALAAVTDALADLPMRPQVLVPELSSIVGAEDYLNALAPAQINAVSHHMYGVDPTALDLGGLHALGQLGTDLGVPLFQTEMQADGFGTALLIHHALTEEGASMYLQTALVGPLAGPTVNPSALIGLTGEQLVLQDPYFAMSHFSRFTDPGWTRVAASTSTPGLLASAWLAPDDALTIVLINAATETMTVGVDLGAERASVAHLWRTVFTSSERFADLGTQPLPATIALPPRSMVTVAMDGQ